MAGTVLHDREAFTIPANTAITAPVHQALTLPDCYIRRIRWRVPPGWWGVAGWQLRRNGVLWVPFIGSTSWIVADDEADYLTVEDEIAAGAFVLWGYNTSGYRSHTLYLDIEYLTQADYLTADTAPVSGLVSLAQASAFGTPTPTPTPGPVIVPTPTPPPTAPAPTPAPVAASPGPPPPRWKNQKVTVITVDPKDASVFWLVTTEPRARHKIADTASSNAYQAAGIPQATLSAEELATYPVLVPTANTVPLKA